MVLLEVLPGVLLMQSLLWEAQRLKRLVVCNQVVAAHNNFEYRNLEDQVGHLW